MREGSLEAPVRHPLDWQSAEFYDEAALDAELRRVFDICHGCRRCFNLCDSFPRLFDLVDNAPSEELDTVESKDFAPVVEACTLCDLCFMTKCPYVPPHEFNLDFPHLMLRYRAKEFKDGKTKTIPQQLAKTDRNGKLGGAVSPIANWAVKTENRLTRPVLEKVVGIDARAVLPKFAGKSFATRAAGEVLTVNRDAPSFGRKAVLYATCFVNYHNPGIGEAARRVLAFNGVETLVVYPECCGMPQLEQGNIDKVADKARAVANHLAPYIKDGWEIIALVPSCSLMLKFEWPLILPDDQAVINLARASWDISEYIIEMNKKTGLVKGLGPVEGGVSLHIACHARAQNIGQKAAELLRLIPNIDLAVTERCSGHGGSWGVMKDNFELAVKMGRPVARAARDSGKAQIASECPLAAEHIVQGMELLDEAAGESLPHREPRHPIEIFASAYGL
ncbi:MAG: heterodisulfide reductase-related iron-sulfur binding cluster [Candidatus Pacebacteria bacterium]|nr:heterodisulfide reductase-related iron-sulfur binding cluster [Candidatus Paceibacterota bacterium]